MSCQKSYRDAYAAQEAGHGHDPVDRRTLEARVKTAVEFLGSSRRFFRARNPNSEWEERAYRVADGVGTRESLGAVSALSFVPRLRFRQALCRSQRRVS